MVGIVFLLYLGLTATGVVNHVSALICLSCQDISQPNLCNYYDVCEDDEVCSVQQYLQENEVRFSVGCYLKDCKRSYRSTNSSLRSTNIDILCHECCTGDFCNSGGCGASGFPATSGPICYNCEQILAGSICHRISVCGQHEECYYSEQSRFGNIVVTSKCQRSHICDALRAESTVIGRRQTDATHNCVKCCTSDLCNEKCKDNNESTTSAVTQVTTSTTPMTKTTETTTLPVDASSSMGNRYMIMFLINLGHSDKYKQIILAADLAGWCIIRDNFHNTVRNVTLTKGINSFNITNDIVMDKNVIEHKSIIIETSVKVTAYTFNYMDVSSDGFLNIPTSQCSTTYRVPSYKPIGSFSSVFSLGSLQNYNNVSVTMRLTSGSVVIGGHSYSDGDTINMILEENETFQLASSHDLTGTEIISSKPVCVVAGAQCANVGNIACSHLSEMILPVKDFSYAFITPFLKTSPTVVVRVLAKEDQTFLKYNNRTTLLSRQNGSMFNLNDTYSLLSDKPVLVMLYAIGLSYSADPFMMTIPSITQYLSEYVFAVVDSGFTSYLSVIIQGNKTEGLRLDNHKVFYFSKSARSISINGTEFISFAISVSPGFHRMNHIYNETFGLFIYGNKHDDGYGYPAGINL